MSTFIFWFTLAWILIGSLHLLIVYKVVLQHAQREESRFWALLGTAWTCFYALILWPGLYLTPKK